MLNRMEETTWPSAVPPWTNCGFKIKLQLLQATHSEARLDQTKILPKLAFCSTNYQFNQLSSTNCVDSQRLHRALNRELPLALYAMLPFLPYPSLPLSSLLPVG